MVRAFVTAFNGGRVDDLVSRAFVWFSFHAPDVNDAAYGPDDGLRYLHERQAAGDRMDLKSLQVNTEESWDGAWGFGYAVTVTRAGRRYDAQGKGELYCGGSYPGVSIWSMGAP